MNSTIEITPTEIGLKVGEAVSVPVNGTATNITFTNDNESVVSVKFKKGKLVLNGLLKGAANVIVSGDDAEDVRLVVSVLEASESGTVYFHSNGGKGSMNPQSIAINETFSLPECGFEAPEGKVFKGWSEDANGESGIKAVNDLLQFHQDGEHTIYAIYEDAPEVEPEPETPVEPEPQPEPEPEPQPEIPEEEVDGTVADLLTKLDNDWDGTLEEILKVASSKYKSLIVKLVAYNDIYGTESLKKYVPREQAGNVYDLYVNIADCLEWGKKDGTKFTNVVGIVKKFFAKYPSTFGHNYLVAELSFWANAAYKPQATDAKCWEELVKFFNNEEGVNFDNITLSEEVKERLSR